MAEKKKLPAGMVQKGNAYYYKRKRAGKQTWWSLGTDFQAACRQLQKLRRGSFVPQHTGTLGQAARRWLAQYIATTRTAKGQRLAAARVEKYLVPYWGGRPIGRVEGNDVRSYRLWLEEQPISATTVWHMLADLRCLLRWAEESGYVERSPFPRRIMPRLQEQPPDRLSDAEVEHLLQVPDPWAFVIRVALATGLRWGELVRAQASHVEGDMLRVTHTKSRRQRRVPLPPAVLRDIRGRVGRLVPYSERSCGSFARDVRRYSGVRRFHVHQLRHTMACQWLEQGGSLAALQQILGHASITTTQRYARLSDAAVLAEARRLQGGVEEGVEVGLDSTCSTQPKVLEL